MDGDDTTKHPQMRSRRFPVKYMFMSVVGRQIPDKNFDGRIFLERKSKTYTVKKKPRIRDLVMKFSSIRKSKMASGDNFMFIIYYVMI